MRKKVFVIILAVLAGIHSFPDPVPAWAQTKESEEEDTDEILLLEYPESIEGWGYEDEQGTETESETESEPGRDAADPAAAESQNEAELTILSLEEYYEEAQPAEEPEKRDEDSPAAGEQETACDDYQAAEEPEITGGDYQTAEEPETSDEDPQVSEEAEIMSEELILAVDQDLSDLEKIETEFPGNVNEEFFEDNNVNADPALETEYMTGEFGTEMESVEEESETEAEFNEIPNESDPEFREEISETETGRAEEIPETETGNAEEVSNTETGSAEEVPEIETESTADVSGMWPVIQMEENETEAETITVVPESEMKSLEEKSESETDFVVRESMTETVNENSESEVEAGITERGPETIPVETEEKSGLRSEQRSFLLGAPEEPETGTEEGSPPETKPEKESESESETESESESESDSELTDTTWQEDFAYTLDLNNKRIYLKDFIVEEGSDYPEEYRVPAKAVINGMDYQVWLRPESDPLFGEYSSGSTPGASIKRISFEEGVVFPEQWGRYRPASNLFAGTQVEEVDLTGADTSRVTSMKEAFSGCKSLKKVNFGNIDTSNVKDFSDVFVECNSLQALDLSPLDTSGAATAAYMIRYCNRLMDVDLSSFTGSLLKEGKWYLRYESQNVIRRITIGSGLDGIIMPGERYRNVETGIEYTAPQFLEGTVPAGTYEDVSIVGIVYESGEVVINKRDFDEYPEDIYRYNTANYVAVGTGFEFGDPEYVWGGYWSEKASRIHAKATSIRLETDLVVPGGVHCNWFQLFYMVTTFEGMERIDFSQATDISEFFQACHYIKYFKLKGPAKHLTNLNNMFESCYDVKTIDLSEFWADNITDMTGMFIKAGRLDTLILGDHWAFVTDTGLAGYWKHLESGEGYPASELLRVDFSARPGTYVRSEPEEHYYVGKGLGENNVWEVHSPKETFKGYCIDSHRGAPTGLYTRREVTNDDLLAGSLLDLPQTGGGYGPAEGCADMRETLITLIYYGWPNNGGGLQEKYALTDLDFMNLTQKVIWHFTNSYFSSLEGQSDEFLELCGKRFLDIPGHESLKLYVYESVSANQNMVSLEGLQIGEYGGVEVWKQDAAGNPLENAVFTIYDEAGNPVREMVSDGNGLASICKTSQNSGLSLGTYTVKETSAPYGYELSTDQFTFTLSRDGQIAVGGFKNDEATISHLKFINRKIEEVQAGGIKVKKLDESGKPLADAEFTIFTKEGEAVRTIYSDEDGYAMTGKRALPLGSYVVRETKAPAGYIRSNLSRTITLTKDNAYPTITYSYRNQPKKGSVTITARKTVNGRKPGSRIFSFELLSDEGEVLQTAQNTADGIITFNPISFTAKDLGMAVFRIREVSGQEEGIVYDTHEEVVRILILEEEERLSCTADYSGEEAVFDNQIPSSMLQLQVSVGKTDAFTGEVLGGARLSLYDSDDHLIEEWVSADGEPHRIEASLAAGQTYRIHEEEAPRGYQKGEDLYFTPEETEDLQRFDLTNVKRQIVPTGIDTDSGSVWSCLAIILLFILRCKRRYTGTEFH